MTAANFADADTASSEMIMLLALEACQAGNDVRLAVSALRARGQEEQG
jgi:hypothetical protein